ncbi:magnesium protoporphyrin IX methyltransferase [Pontivivens ytuae]|uniref:magnesium protoporphyrin IX methyltransferase n=1 Tax=Pontivivens ytuae TaxID=2789856 RepID=UPI0030CE8C18
MPVDGPGAGAGVVSSYSDTRARLEDYFDRTASATWERLTSDAPVSRIRATVRAGRDEMRAALLAMLPEDLTGARVLDAGAGPGEMSFALAERGAEVVAADISPSLLDVAARRCPEELRDRISFVPGDMLNADLGTFDHAIAMDSLIHYRASDIAAALDRLMGRVRGTLAFTVAPATPLLSMMHLAGKAFPKADRAPAIVPVSPARLGREMVRRGAPAPQAGPRVARGFYISQAMELR